MQAIFRAHYRAADGAALIEIDGGDNAGHWRMTLYAARNLPDGRTAVVVNGAPSDEKGADNSAHASAGMLGCEPETEDCWDVGGTLGTVPATHGENDRDIVVDFAGRHFRVTESEGGKYVEHLTRTVRQTARYRFDGKAYVLVSGENPVPAIDNSDRVIGFQRMGVFLVTYQCHEEAGR